MGPLTRYLGPPVPPTLSSTYRVKKQQNIGCDYNHPGKFLRTLSLPLTYDVNYIYFFEYPNNWFNAYSVTYYVYCLHKNCCIKNKHV